MAATSILIGIPAYGGSVKTKCMLSVISLRDSLAAMSIKSDVSTVDSANIVFARNFLATRLLNQSETHLLFVDSDMEFQSESIKKMVALDLPIVGCVCPKRSLTPGFNIWHDGNTNLQVKNEMADVGGVGMGVTLIKREVFEKLKPTVSVNKNDDRPDVYGFFDLIDTPRHQLTEDLSFCRRWREAGGSIRALLNEDIGHIGDFTYRGKYLDYLQASKASPKP